MTRSVSTLTQDSPRRNHYVTKNCGVTVSSDAQVVTWPVIWKPQAYNDYPSENGHIHQLF